MTSSASIFKKTDSANYDNDGIKVYPRASDGSFTATNKGK